MSDAQGPGESGPQTQLPGPPPSAPPPPLPPTPVERGGMRALSLSIIGLLLLFLPIPGLALLGLALLIAGVVTGVRARRRAKRVLTRAPGAVGGIVVGAIGLCFAVAGIAIGAMVATEFSDYENCRSSALTITDKQTCQDRYFPKIERKLHLPAGSMDRYRSMF
ncbi:hypothetical protein [Actinoallomurus acaciae]|uniref:DUF4190 domain-containing protein n=1 Tax=Actinoallomurus acaciae TaxID=502577 RepID=A0ABV5YE55_9ACTN